MWGSVSRKPTGNHCYFRGVSKSYAVFRLFFGGGKFKPNPFGLLNPDLRTHGLLHSSVPFLLAAQGLRNGTKTWRFPRKKGQRHRNRTDGVFLPSLIPSDAQWPWEKKGGILFWLTRVGIGTPPLPKNRRDFVFFQKGSNPLLGRNRNPSPPHKKKK